MPDWIGIFPIDWSAIAALSTIAIAFIGYRINRRLRRDAEKAAQYSVLVEYRREILQYSSEFFELTAKAIAEAEKSGATRDTGVAYNCAAALSALIDKGRFIFPNYVSNMDYGKDKGPAFEGFRREPLDAILAAYFAANALKEPGDEAHFCNLAHRELTRAQQPFNEEFDHTSPISLLIESRRSFLNSVVPSTYPRDWRKRLVELLGERSRLTDDEVSDRVARHKLPPKMGSH